MGPTSGQYLNAVEQALPAALKGMESMPLSAKEQQILHRTGDPFVPLEDLDEALSRSLRGALFHALEHLHDAEIIFFSASDEDIERAAHQLLERAKKRPAQ